MYKGLLSIANWPLGDVMICNMFIIYVLCNCFVLYTLYPCILSGLGLLCLLYDHTH